LLRIEIRSDILLLLTRRITTDPVYVFIDRIQRKVDQDNPYKVLGHIFKTKMDLRTIEDKNE